ncbi:hypothetical protein GGI20_004640 [Coemansia sp. BCRC 34301]|nr:hypothetical protein GGI20_004640 [Coemansia sp. BCRC 34301]
MEPTAKDLEVERGAFRVDVCGHQFSVPAEQAAASDMEKQLLQLLQPGTARLRAQAAAATQAGVSAIEALSSSALARLRRTRRRESTAAVDSPASRLFSDDDESWTADAATGIVCSGLDVVASAVGRGVSIATCDKVVDGVATLSIGGTVLGVLALARDDVLAPFASGVMESVAALMNRHARMHADVRFAWTLLLAPGTVRVCLVEQDAMHVTRAQSLGSDGGRRLVASVVALAGVGEAWRLGRDPTMRAYEGGWEITCPGDGTPRAVYAQRDPVFAADTFFGRFTRCFLVALDPGGSPDYVLKDSWQLVLVEEELNDEVCVLRRVTNALAGVECSGGVFQRLVCGGTVRVNGDDDSSRLVLGGALDTYARWTVAHGARRSAAAHRLHRRMVTGPVGMALHSLDSERDAVAAVAGAMVAHASVLDHAATLHRDVSLGNVLAVRINGVIRGMLIDFDHAVDVDSLRNQRMPGHVGTAPFMSISNLEGLDVPRTAADDWEAALALLLCLAARPLHRDALCARLAAVGSSSGVAEFRRDEFGCRY